MHILVLLSIQQKPCTIVGTPAMQSLRLQSEHYHRKIITFHTNKTLYVDARLYLLVQSQWRTLRSTWQKMLLAAGHRPGVEKPDCDWYRIRATIYYVLGWRVWHTDAAISINIAFIHDICRINSTAPKHEMDAWLRSGCRSTGLRSVVVAAIIDGSRRDDCTQPPATAASRIRQLA